jgi:ribosomal protein L34E
MTISKLPEITLTCRNNHDFATRAKGGSTVRCKTCGVPTHVPKYRPTTAARARGAARDDSGAGLRARWAAQRPVTGTEWYPPLDAADECPTCGEGRAWEPRRTMVFCRACKTLGLPMVVLEHAARSAEIAVRAGTVATRAPSQAEQRAARVQLRRQKQAALDDVREVIEAFDPDDLSEHIARQAREAQRALAAYLPEIQAAETLETLAEIESEIEAIGAEAQRAGLIDAITRQREAQERAAERAEWEQREAEQLERERQEQERADRERQRAAAQQRKAIAPRPPSPQVQGIAILVNELQRHFARKLERIKQCGACQFKHPWAADGMAATRRYQGSRVPGTPIMGAPEVRACDKHHNAAEQWLTEQGWPNQTYFELPEQPQQQEQWGWAQW